MKDIVVYGLGGLGRKIAKELKVREEAYHFHIIAFIDKQDLNNQCEFNVLQPKELHNLKFDYILITSEKWFEDISKELQSEYSISKEKIIHLKQLISEERYYCNLCDLKVPFMLDSGIESPAFSKRKIIGGGIREKCICPICGGNDRERWLEYVLNNKIDLFNKKGTVLHFAPEKRIEKNFRSNKNMVYITADIETGRADRVEDITHINFPDKYFDYIICNHVLGHIKDEKQAFMELKRCIKEDGKVIFSVPICWEIDTYENDSVETDEDRLIEYGQKDHVRLYGRDLKERLAQFGFSADYYQVKNVLPEEEIATMRLIPEDTIWILSL